MALKEKPTLKTDITSALDDGGGNTVAEVRGVILDTVDSLKAQYGRAFILAKDNPHQAVEVRYTKAATGWSLLLQEKPEPVTSSLTLAGTGSGNSLEIDLPLGFLLFNEEPNDFQFTIRRIASGTNEGFGYGAANLYTAGTFTLRAHENTTLAEIKDEMERFDYLTLSRPFRGNITLNGSGTATLASTVLPALAGSNRTFSFAGGTDAHFIEVAPGAFEADKEVTVKYAPGFHELRSLVRDWGNGVSIHAVGAEDNTHHPESPKTKHFDFPDQVPAVEVTYWQDSSGTSPAPAGASRKTVYVGQGLFLFVFDSMVGNRYFHFQVPSRYKIASVAIEQRSKLNTFSSAVSDGVRTYHSRKITASAQLEVLIEVSE